MTIYTLFDFPNILLDTSKLYRGKMTSLIDKNIYNQLLIKFQPKVIENEEEYQSFYHVLLELMMQSEKISEDV
jgi:hypothetical protein